MFNDIRAPKNIKGTCEHKERGGNPQNRVR